MLRIGLVTLAMAAVGCDLDTTEKDSCTGPEDCLDGFACDQGAGECRPEDEMREWDAVAADFVSTLCDYEETCTGRGDGCVADVTTDMEDARAALDEEGEARCIDCMEAKLAVLEESLAADCGEVDDIEAVFAVCDLDPEADFDENGDPTDDDNEACAGFP